MTSHEELLSLAGKFGLQETEPGTWGPCPRCDHNSIRVLIEGNAPPYMHCEHVEQVPCSSIKVEVTCDWKARITNLRKWIQEGRSVENPPPPKGSKIRIVKEENPL